MQKEKLDIEAKKRAAQPQVPSSGEAAGRSFNAIAKSIMKNTAAAEMGSSQTEAGDLPLGIETTSV